jgi:hypothetical protein
VKSDEKGIGEQSSTPHSSILLDIRHRVYRVTDIARLHFCSHKHCNLLKPRLVTGDFDKCEHSCKKIVEASCVTICPIVHWLYILKNL